MPELPPIEFVDPDRLLTLWRAKNKMGYQKKIASKGFLHENSRTLTSFLGQHGLPEPGSTVFELGCGSGRNLHYLLGVEDLKLVGNDLCRSECLKHMEPQVKQRVRFIEQDTLSLLQGDPFQVDLLLASDHFMHLPPESLQTCLNLLVDRWSPSFICLRECLTARLKPRKKLQAPRWVHDYSPLDRAFRVIAEQGVADPRRRDSAETHYTLTLFRHRG